MKTDEGDDDDIFWTSSPDQDTVHSVVIVGGGVVGCALLRHLTLLQRRLDDNDHNDGKKMRHSILMVEAAQDVVSGASGGNSGIFHTGFDANKTECPIELQCMRNGFELWKKLHQGPTASSSPLALPWERCGAFVVAWTNDELKALDGIERKAMENGLSSANGDLKRLSSEELLRLEPNLGRHALGALWIREEGFVDPWLTPMFYLHEALRNGAKLRRRCCVIQGQREGDHWNLQTSTGGLIKAKVVINCAGNYGDMLEQVRSDEPPKFEIMPRKGQFVVFRRKPNSQQQTQSKKIVNSVILPVPSEKTKGVIVFRIAAHEDLFVVGPTAEDGVARNDITTPASVVDFLSKKGEAMLPTLLNEAEIVGTYAGVRPATQFKDYQINVDSEKGWITVAGIRSTGLTSALGIAQYVGDLYEKHFPSNETSASVGQQQQQQQLQQHEERRRLSEELVSVYQQALQRTDASTKRGEDDSVVVQLDGRIHRVAHRLNVIAAAQHRKRPHPKL
eukprot:TRINITY_DN1183_c0_g1_i2.p1 TRINITY_DN1183_c0_g1~~TRINITY_DN1183_c0_g1_i2.p1  ORF type:complete len:506 (+),score=134.56 TRINITY_DN1183_c0_g1_i2:259-1776(+)